MQVFARPRKASRQSRPLSLRVPTLILRRVTWQRISFSEPLVCSGVSGRSKTHHQQLGLLACRRASKRSSVVKPVQWRRKMRSNRARSAETPAIARAGLVRFEVGVEIPNELTHMLLGGTVPLCEGRPACAPAVQHGPSITRAAPAPSAQRHRSARLHRAGSHAHGCRPIGRLQ